MGIFDRVCGKFGLVDTEEEMFEEEEAEETLPRKSQPAATQPSNVVDIHSGIQRNAAKMKVVIVEPSAFEDVKHIADCLKAKSPVVINFEQTQSDIANRVVDFMMGSAYALGGTFKKVAHNVYLCTPSNVNVSFTRDRASISSDMSWLGK